MNVLVIAAHPDDEVLGPGATLAKHARSGDRVFACVLCASAGARADHPGGEALGRHMEAAGTLIGIQEWMTFEFPNMKFNAVPNLDIVQAIEAALVRFRPEIVYTHHVSDVNTDHQIVSRATEAAIRLPERGRPSAEDLPIIRRVLAYETPSSTDWAMATERPFVPTVFSDVSTTLDLKLAALREYEGVLRPFPHPCSETGIRALAQVRGMASAHALAEAFVLMRERC